MGEGGEKRKRKTWMEIRAERELAKGAVWPPSTEQIDEEVARRKKVIADKNALEQEAWDMEWDILVKASKAKNN